MGKVNDYINSLEGQVDLDPIKIAKDLSELHKSEYEPVVAKVEQLTSTIATKDQQIADAQREISEQKALNFDLTMQLPGQDQGDNKPDTVSGKESGDPRITVADLFSPDVRKHNHFLRRN